MNMSSSITNSLNKAENQSNGIERFYLVGIVFAFLGVFLPWWCQGDFINYCTAGISINLSGGLLAFKSEQLIVNILFLSIIGLMYSTFGSTKAQSIYLICISIFVFGYLVFKDLIIIANYSAGFMFMLTVIIVWLTFNSFNSTHYTSLMITILGIALIFISLYQILNALYWQIAERDIIGGLTVQLGLPLIFVGSLFIVIIKVKKNFSNQRAT